MSKNVPHGRRHLLYKSKVEYTTEPGVYALNHVSGCRHGCAYCYAFKMARRFGKVDTRDEWARPRLIRNYRELLERDLKVTRQDPVRRVFMCFMTDPFPWNPNEGKRLAAIEAASIDIIQTLNEHDIPVTVLTKGHLPWQSLKGLHPDNEYGITLTTFDESMARKFEPGAAPPQVRHTLLHVLARSGCKTWISIEPFGLVHPNFNFAPKAHSGLEGILHACDFARRIVFGRANYCGDAYKNPAWYRECSGIVKRFCESRDIDFIIKKGTPQ